MISDLFIINLLPNHAAIDKCELVGSQVTCNPPPPDTDQDVLILLKKEEKLGAFTLAATNIGYTFEGSEIEDTDHQSMKFVSLSLGKTALNLIVTKSQEFYDKFLIATHVAKQLNLLNKNDRILVFQAVLYANAWKPSSE